MRKKIIKYLDAHIDKNKFQNKNVFITGGNSGIGFELAKEILYLNGNLFLLCRNVSKAENAKKDLLKEFPNANISIILLDLANFESIKNASEEIKKYDIDYFVNNAGVYHLEKSYTKDNLEIIIGTNFIGTLYLNDLILPYFSSLNHKVHVLFESSITTKFGKIDYDDFFMDKKYKKMAIYARSKLCINNAFYNYLDEYKNSNLVFSLTHPGGVYTPLMEKAYKNKVFRIGVLIFMKIFFHNADKAALSIIYSLNKDIVSFSGPRGLFELSGYPKNCKFKKNKNYTKCVSFGRNQINIINKDIK